MAEVYSRAAIRTRRIILNAFCTLLEEKDFSDIRIADILEAAQVSKGTFYNHFLDKYDLASKAVAAFLEDYENYLSTVRATDARSQADLIVCNFMNRHRSQYRALTNLREKEVHFHDLIYDFQIQYYHRHALASSNNTALEALQFASQHNMILRYMMSLDHLVRPEDIVQVNRAIAAISGNMLRREK